MYLSASEAEVRKSLLDIDNDRVSTFVFDNFDLNQSDKDRFIIKGLSKEDILKHTYIIPVFAQREGNLVTIKELENKRFIKLVHEAIKYGKNLIQKDIHTYIPTNSFSVCWWKKDARFFIPNHKKQKDVSSLREKILLDLQLVQKNTPKPSRVQIKTQFSYDKRIEAEPFQRQNGIIQWNTKYRNDNNRWVTCWNI